MNRTIFVRFFAALACITVVSLSSPEPATAESASSARPSPPRASLLDVRAGKFTVNTLFSSTPWPQVHSHSTDTSADIVTLRPGDIVESSKLYGHGVSSIPDYVDGAKNLEWLLQNFQNSSWAPVVRGVPRDRVVADAYQMAVWAITANLRLQRFTTGPRAQVARLAQDLLRRARVSNPHSIALLKDPRVHLLRTRTFLSGARFVVELSGEELSGNPISKQLVTIRVNNRPLRGVQTDADGNTFSTDLDYDRARTGTISATWDYKIPAGAVLSDDQGAQPLLLVQSIDARLPSDTIKHERPPLKLWSKSLIADTLDTLPSAIQPLVMAVAGVLLLAWPVLGTLQKMDGFRGLLRRFAKAISILVVLATVVMLAIYFKARSVDDDRFESDWLHRPTASASVSTLSASSSSASSQFFNGADTTRYSADCVRPGHADSSGRPWMSARNDGLPQMLRLDFPSVVDVSAVKVVPGWSNGQPEDFLAAPRPESAMLMSETGLVDRLSFETNDSYEHARSTDFVDVQPLRAKSLYLIVDRVTGGNEDRVAIASVEVSGAQPPKVKPGRSSVLTLLTHREHSETCH